MKRLIFLLCLAAVLSAVAENPRLGWDVDFRSVFDNREGSNAYNETRTFFQTQLSPTIAAEWGVHRLAGGVVWTQPIGTEWNGYNIAPTLYYRYATPRLRASMGFFPRAQLIEQMPTYMWCDSLNYAQANIRGAMIQYQGVDGFFEAFLDWRGMQSDKVREAFSIQAHGKWQRPESVLTCGGTAMLNHLAKSRKPQVTEYIVDNLLASVWVGVDLSHRTALDSLALRVGPIVNLTRYRKYDNWEAPMGFTAHLDLAWWRLVLTDDFYVGKRLLPHYGEFGSLLHFAEPFYQSRVYNRTNIAATLISTSRVNMQAGLVFNVTADCFNFYQRLTLRVFLSSQQSSRPLQPLY